MSEDLNTENSDVTEVAIEPKEAASPLDQLKEFDQSDSKGCALVSSFVLFLVASSLVTLLAVAVACEGVKIPISVCVLMGLVPFVVSFGAVAPVRRWFSGVLHSPFGYVTSGSIRFLGAMFLLLVSLLALGLALSPDFQRSQVESWRCLLLVSYVVLGLLMRFFPRGELE